MFHLKSILNKNNKSLFFIFSNIVSAFLGFIKSFVFMKFFNFYELGLITMINTGALLIGFFQIGLINGGYRIIALGDKESTKKTNNVIFSYFGVLTLFLIIIYLIGIFSGIINEKKYTFFGVAIGIMTLITNWLTNVLIANKDYTRLNYANLISSFIGVFSLFLILILDINGAIISLFIPQFLFIGIILASKRNELPDNFDFNFKYIKYILGFGFIPFLSGLFFLAYQQIERWSVNFFLGPEALGKMYLVFLTTTLWVLIPTSINSLFFPKAVKLFAKGNISSLKNTIKEYFFVIIFYSIIASLLIIFLFSKLVYVIFPKHYEYVNLVFILLPGLMLRNMCDPINLLLNSIVKLKPIFWSDIISTFFYGIIILTLALMKIFSLENVLLAYVLYNLIKFIYLLIVLLSIKKKLNGNLY